MPHPRPQTPSTYLPSIVAALALGLTVAACSGRSVAPAPVVQAGPEPAVLSIDRGRLLYDTHCISCHDSQLHWRDQSLVGSWSDLVEQVDRWQTNSGQQWSASEVGDVSAYLNSLYYRMPCRIIGCAGDSTALLASIATPAVTPDPGIHPSRMRMDP